MATSDGRIVEWAGYGEHIALRCTLHPEASFFTKNIGWIGARKVFIEVDCPCEGVQYLEPAPPKHVEDDMSDKRTTDDLQGFLERLGDKPDDAPADIELNTELIEDDRER